LQRQYLPADSAIIQYHLGVQHSYLWIVDAQRVRAFSLPPAATITADASRVIAWLAQNPERRDWKKQGSFKRAMKNLSEVLLGQLANVPLPQRLILVPDGILHQLPFAALEMPDTFKPLGLSHDLVHVPSSAYLKAGKHPRAAAQFSQAVLAMADPVFSVSDPRVHHRCLNPSPDPGLDLPRLPFSGEIGVIQSRVPASRRRVFRGFDASRETLDKLSLADFGVLHFSTHALIDDSIPEISRIVLSMVNPAGCTVDGVLRPYQLAQLHLNGSIVVLSACNTALGKRVLGEGLAGLTESLLYAGGSQLVLTLTEVDAEASSYFFSDVYRWFLPGSANMEHAVTLARRAMADSRQYSDPYYWAPFIVVGRPADAVDGKGNGSNSRRQAR